MKHRIVLMLAWLVLASTTASCVSWRPVTSPAEAQDYSIVRVEMPDGRRFMLHDPSPDQVAEALKYASSVDGREVDHAGRAALVLLCVVGGLGLVVGAFYLVFGGM